MTDNSIAPSSDSDSTVEHIDTATVGMTAAVKHSGHSAKAAKKAAHAKLVGSFTLMHMALIGLTLLLVLQWWNSTNQINQLREELAQRLQMTDVSSAETKIIAKSILETDKELQVKLALLENKQAESESHALALQQLYQDLSKNRDDWALSEIEQVLSTASQQLQLAGNVQGALIALQNADARLARSDKPHFITIRRSIAHDIDRLKALPILDLPGIALRIDSAIAQVDSMPLLVDATSAAAVNSADPTKVGKSAESTSAKKSTSVATSAATSKSTRKKAPTAVERVAPVSPVEPEVSWKRWLSDRWQSWSTATWGEIRQLVRIRNVENPDALLLAPSQGYFVKENVKLRLLNARLALLSRNEDVFRSDLISAQNEIARYFDQRAKQTQTVQTLLRQIQRSDVSIDMPTLAESLNAVRNFTVVQ